MSWVTIIWAMVASASLTLAAIYWLVWYRNRAAWAHLLFSLTAVSTTGYAFCELLMMRSETPAQLLAAVGWAQLPMFVWLVSITWFVWVYVGAGRLWLAWTITGLRTFYLLLNFLVTPNVNLREVTSLRHMEFLGESVTVVGGVPNPLTLFGQFVVVLVLIFVADASITAWRRGDRRKALMVGGSVEFFLLAGLATSSAVLWANVQAPIVTSLLYLGVVAVMGYELSRDVLRASQLVQKLQVSEAGLLENQATLQASHKQISDLFGRLVAAQEMERRRIARDLHDEVSQRIAGLSIMISSVKRKLRGHPDEADLTLVLTTMQQDTIALAEEIRDVSHKLHPSQLQHSGLVTALSACCAQFKKLQAIAVTYHADADIGDVEVDTALCLYRITQEALHNVAKHAEARHVDVTLTRTTDSVQLLIADDGNGFDLVGTREKASGLGLVSIDERVRLLRGSVHIETQPRGGTRVLVQIPCPQVIPSTHQATRPVTTVPERSALTD